MHRGERGVSQAVILLGVSDNVTMLQTDVVLALRLSYTHIHTQSHTVSRTEVTAMNDTVTLEAHTNGSGNASSFTRSNMVSQETAVEGCKVDLIF